jgi:hypothetical protein
MERNIIFGEFDLAASTVVSSNDTRHFIGFLRNYMS